MSDSVQPHRWQPTRLPRPWDSPGKNFGVGCHFLLQCTKVKSESEVAQSFPTLSDPMDCSPPGSSVHGIFQARVLEWHAIAFSALFLTFFSLFLCRSRIYLTSTKSITHARHYGWKGWKDGQESCSPKELLIFWVLEKEKCLYYKLLWKRFIWSALEPAKRI